MNILRRLKEIRTLLLQGASPPLHPGVKIFEQDPGVIVVDRIEDFSLLQRHFNGAALRGILMPFNPLTDDQKRDVIAYAKCLISPEKLTYDPYTYVSSGPLPPRPEGLKIIRNSMDRAYREATHNAPCMRNGMIINHTLPDDFHEHDAALIYTLTGEGTIIRTKQGDIYSVPTEYLFMIGKNLPHKAPIFVPSYEHPRITFLVS